MFRGSMPALVTPFKADGSVDENAFADLVEWQIQQGSHGLVPVGTTGESPTLTHDEHKRVVQLCVEVAAGRVPVIAGAGSNNTAASVEFVEHAEAVGADGVLVVTPYYNKPNQRGLIAHFEAVAAASSLPLFIYNVPGRSIVDILPETMGYLVKSCPTIVGVKDATGEVDRVSDQRATCGADFVQISGEDASALGFNAQGGTGCISVSSNVAPALCAQMQEASLAGDRETALALQAKLLLLHRAMFAEPSPGCPKYALSLLGKCDSRVRLPLVPLSKETEAVVEAAMRHAGLLD
ncbi:4-hydroxy-tetrahydrodipicolinate synthase [Rhizobiaceae bacterium]|nr:4-hydroxy-tetrahydrodipicolinate synthase [Rhizobiaceae bacterium]